MKTIAGILISAGSIAIGVLFFLSVPEALAATNVVANPSMETVGSPNTKPDKWTSNKWGSNTATFQYKTTGAQDGSRSVAVTVSKYVSGDAKWYFDPVTVSANTSYDISDYYQSTAMTQVVVVTYDANNTPTYVTLAPNLPAKAAWTKYTGVYKTPANAKKLSVFHVIARNGTLTIDNANVSIAGATTTPPAPTTTPPVNNLLPNPSIETALDATTPDKWHTGSWGTNSPTYAYVTGDGHQGTRSVKVTMASHQDGDAKWMFDSLPLAAGDYRFTAWYKTNVTPHVVVQYDYPDGTEAFSGLPNPEPGANAGTAWQKYSESFSVPAGVKGVTVFFFLTGNGWVQTDDYSITTYTYPAYNRGLVSLTFDDGFEGNVNSVLPKLAQYGFKSTHCFATQYIEGVPEQVANVQAIGNAGHEVCSHTITHPFLTQLTDAEINEELTHAKTFLESISGQSVTSFASPYGDYDMRVNNRIKQYYATHRTTDEGFNAKDNLAPYRLRVQNMTPQTTLAEFNGWVNKAKADKTWLILLYHAIKPADPGPYDTLQSAFNSQMDALASSGITVRTWKDALAEVKAQ